MATPYPFSTSRIILSLSTAKNIINKISNFYGIDEKLVFGDTRKAEIVRARFVAIYVLREFSKMSFSAIKDDLHYKDNTSIMHGHNEIVKLLNEDSEFVEEFNEIKKILFVA